VDTGSGQITFSYTPDASSRFPGKIAVRALFADGTHFDVKVVDGAGFGIITLDRSEQRYVDAQGQQRNLAVGSVRWQLVRLIPTDVITSSGRPSGGAPLEFGGSAVRIPPKPDMAAVLTRTGVTFVRENKPVGQTALLSVLDASSSAAINGTYLTGNKIQPVAFSSDLSRAYIAGNGAIYVVDTITFKLIETIAVPEGRNITSLLTVGSLLFIGEGTSWSSGPSGSRLMIMGTDPGTANYNKIVTLKGTGIETSRYGVGGMAVAGDGRTLVVTTPQMGAYSGMYAQKVPGNVLVFDLGTLNIRTGVLDAPIIAATAGDRTGGLPLNVTATSDRDRFLVANLKDYDKGLGTLTIQRDGQGKITGARLGYVRMSQPLAGIRIDRLNIQRTQSAVLVTEGGVEYAIVADDNNNFEDAYWRAMFEAPMFMQLTPFGPPTPIGGSASAKKVAVGGKLGIVRDPFGKLGVPEYLGATLPLDGYGIVNLSLSEDGKVLIGQLKGGYGTLDQFVQQSPQSHAWRVSDLIAAALSAPEPMVKHIKLPDAAEQLIPTNTAAVAGTVFDPDDIKVEFGGNLGDVIEVDLKDLIARKLAGVPAKDTAEWKNMDARAQSDANNRVREKEQEVQNIFFSVGTDWAAYTDPARIRSNPDGMQLVTDGPDQGNLASGVPLIVSRDANGGQTHNYWERGIFYVAPNISEADMALLRAGSRITAPKQASFTFTYQVKDEAGQWVWKSGSVSVSATDYTATGREAYFGDRPLDNPGYSAIVLSGNVGVGQANNKLDVFKVEQRLRYLGFPALGSKRDAQGRLDNTATPHDFQVDGAFGENEARALRLFEKVVRFGNGVEQTGTGKAKVKIPGTNITVNATSTTKGTATFTSKVEYVPSGPPTTTLTYTNGQPPNTPAAAQAIQRAQREAEDAALRDAQNKADKSATFSTVFDPYPAKTIGGVADPADGSIDTSKPDGALNLNWLNAYNAPHWMQFFEGNGVYAGTNARLSGWLNSAADDLAFLKNGVFGTSWMFDIMQAASASLQTLYPEAKMEFYGATDANLGAAYWKGANGNRHSLGMSFNVGIEQYISTENQKKPDSSDGTLTIPPGTPLGWNYERANTLAGMLQNQVNNQGNNFQKLALQDVLSVYAATQDDTIAGNGSRDEISVVNGNTDAATGLIRSALFGTGIQRTGMVNSIAIGADPWLTAKELAAIMGCSLTTATDWLPFIQEALETFNIKTMPQIVGFIANMAGEVGPFNVHAESLNYSADALMPGGIFGSRFTAQEAQQYGRVDGPNGHAANQVMIGNIAYGNENAIGASLGNGNRASGDGYNFRGGGLLQLTGRTNYTNANTALNALPQILALPPSQRPDLVNDPNSVNTNKRWAALAAGWDYTHGPINARDAMTTLSLAAFQRAAAIINRGPGNADAATTGIAGWNARVDAFNRAVQLNWGMSPGEPFNNIRLVLAQLSVPAYPQSPQYAQINLRPPKLQEIVLSSPLVTSGSATAAPATPAAELTAALDAWASADLGAVTELVAAASHAVTSVADLSSGLAGQATDGAIVLDDNGGGNGWFIDPSPADNDEFLPTADPGVWVAKAGSAAEGKTDLLSTLVHEFGHVLGFEHSDDASAAMGAVLRPGERRLPTGDELAQLLAALHQLQQHQGDAALSTGGLDAISALINSSKVIFPAMGTVGQRHVPAYLDAVHATLLDGQFAAQSSLNSWTTAGSVTIDNDGAVLGEASRAQTRLAQGFMVNTGDRLLSFTLAANHLRGPGSGPSDAFEAALLDANTGLPLAGTVPLSHSDALLNLQADGTERLANGVRKATNADGSATYYIDLPAALAGTPVLLSFDLLGFGDVSSNVTLRDVRVISDPVAIADQVSLDEDNTATGNLLGNDITAGVPVARVELVSSPAHGHLTLGDDGGFSYRPDANYFGADGFAYRLIDAEGRVSNTASVSFTVRPVNDAPVLEPVVPVTVTAGKPFELQPLAGASDVEGDPLTVDWLAQPAHGQLITQPDGRIVYTADSGFVGQDTLSWRVTDGQQASEPVVLHFTIEPASTAPVAQDATLTLDEDGSLLIDFASLGTDAEGDVLAASIVAQPSHGVLMQQPDSRWRYTPHADFHGADSLRFTLSDGHLVSNEATLSLQVASVNDAPRAADLAATLAEDGSITLKPLEAAFDADGDALSAQVVAGPAHGQLIVNADGSLSYRPNADYHGSDSFSYRVSDGSAASGVATVALSVAAVNDAPVAREGSVTVREDGSVVIDLRLLGTDVDSPALQALVLAAPAHGTLTTNPDGTCTYTPAPDFNGTDVLRFVLTDGELQSNEASFTFTVTPVNDAPVLADASAQVDEDGSVTLDALASAHDADGDALTLEIVDAPVHGSLIVHADGRYTYTPNADFFGSDSFSYRVSDGQAASAIATVNVTIAPVNDAPTAADSLAIGEEDQALILSWSDFDIADADGDGLSIRLTELPAEGVLQRRVDADTWLDAVVGDTYTQSDIEAGVLRFVPLADASGGVGYAHSGYGNRRAHYARFGYVVSDGHAEAAQAFVTLDVTALADAPTLEITGANTSTRELFRTGWESAPNADTTSTAVRESVFDGWTLVTGADRQGGGADVFEIWATGDRMADACGNQRTVRAMDGNGNQWLELNDAAGAQSQTLGIERTVLTQAGASYTLTFDVAGRLGACAAYTKIAVYVDDTRLIELSPTSPSSSLDWRTVTTNFTGTGGAQRLRIVTEPSRTHETGRGTMIDDIALTETTQLNRGAEDTRIPLQGIAASLTDTDGSETLMLTVMGLPIGSTLSDGGHSFTVTEDARVADITGWNTATLALNPPANYSGALTLQVQATAIETATGGRATVTKQLQVQVAAVADVPLLTMTARSVSVSREVLATSWESVANRNRTFTLVAGAPGSTLEGWNVLTSIAGKQTAFEIWSSNDQMRNTAGQLVTVQAASGNGINWLQLNNGAGQGHQTLGISRDIPTIDGAVYTLRFDYAGALGLAEANTRIGIYVDGQLVNSYAGTSGLNSLNWQALSFQFNGNGRARKLTIRIEGGDTANNGRGAMIDDIRIVETLPTGNHLVYGLAGTAIALPIIDARLQDTDGSEQLKVELLGLPAGTKLSDGTRSITLSSCGPIDLTGWNLGALSLTPPAAFVGTLSLQVRATSTEASNGASSSVTQDLTVKVFSGTAADPLVPVNPYVNITAANSTTSTTSATSTSGAAANSTPTQILVGPVVSETGMLSISVAAASAPRTWEEEEAAELQRSSVLTDEWLQELEQFARANWEKLVQ
jgi:predicted chitinase